MYLAAIVDDLQQVFGFDDAGWRQQKTVQNQDADLGQVRQTPHIASVSTAERQVRQQPRVRMYSAVCPLRTAAWANAQPRNDLPAPVGPVMSRL